jgi:hypothetical protein
VDRGVENVWFENKKPVETALMATCLKNNHDLAGQNNYSDMSKMACHIIIFFLYTVYFFIVNRRL